MICTFKAAFSLSIEGMTILVTGGAGFIGSHLVRHLLKRCPDYTLINLDALTYAAAYTDVDGAEDLAIHLLKGIANQQLAKGISHYCGTDVMTWLDLARRLFPNQEVLAWSGANSPTIRPKKVVHKRQQ
jgi:uncharacterized protein YbjT (DUF2867 family)